MQPYDFYGQNPELMFQAYGPAFIGLIVLFVLVEVILKGIALWRAARMNKTGWFVALLILNTAGLLPLIFILLTNHEYDRLQHRPKAVRKKKK